VKARIPEAANTAILLSHNDERQPRNLVDIMVAGLGDMLFAADELPSPLPDFLHLRLEHVRTEIAIIADIVVADETGLFEPEYGRRRDQVAAHDLLNARTRTARGAWCAGLLIRPVLMG
jgi:hypothetical protein